MKYGQLTLNVYAGNLESYNLSYGSRFPFWARFCGDGVKRICRGVGFKLKTHTKLQIIAYNRPAKGRIEVFMARHSSNKRWVLYCGLNWRSVHKKFLWALNIEPEAGAYFWVEFKQPKG